MSLQEGSVFLCVVDAASEIREEEGYEGVRQLRRKEIRALASSWRDALRFIRVVQVGKKSKHGTLFCAVAQSWQQRASDICHRCYIEGYNNSG